MTGLLPLIVLALAAEFSAVGAQFDCTFETGFCQWTQAQGTDKYDWKRKVGSTQTRGTGPTGDHTTGSGHYIYFETSVGANGDKAQLTSPTLSIAKGQSKCLIFYYNMYGQHVNALNVYEKTNTAKMNIVWTRHGNQGTNWTEARINFPAATNVQVVIEAVRGRGYKGDIAIDDTKTVNGPCPPLGTILPSVPAGAKTTPMPVGTSCNFETKTICGYTQDKTDDFDWRWSTGSTASAMTGPDNDHTYGTPTGHYMYIESADARPHAKARIVSPRLPGSGTRCLQFYYSMFGQQVNTLNVYAKSQSLGNVLWTLSGNQGMDWKIAQVTIPRGSNYNIVFEAIRGTGSRGDIGIDDILLKHGSCPRPGYCNFEHGTCTWLNTQRNDDFDWVIHQGSTATTHTGPQNDHTTGKTSGHYMYIESSAPQKKGDRARYVSETFKMSSQRKCFQFWYSMKGSDIGTLRVYVVKGLTETVAWQLSGAQPSTWMHARVPVYSPTKNFKFIIEGIVGSGINGDIAIDDMAVNTMTCGVTPSNAMPPSATTTATTTSKPTSTTPRKSTAHVPPGSKPVSCNFDNDLCSWSQISNDNFDWTRHQGSTSSGRTGPHGDHTTGKGFYLYTEVNGQSANKTARLQSKSITSRTMTTCFSFWYHMHGDHIGTLNVYIMSTPMIGSPVWTKTGAQGLTWKHGAITISKRNNPFTILIEAVTSNGNRGDIAIDDVSLANGSCTGSTGPTVHTTVHPGQVVRKCDFEAKSICGYTQDKSDNFDWTWTSHRTSSYGTGPSNDHTYGTTSGHYLYTEASYQRQGNKARIFSPTYHDSQTMCANFYYHMYGSSMGTFNVYAKVGNNTGRPLFSRSGNQGNKWIVGQATVPASTATSGYQMVFEGVRGSDYKSDIALDDVSFTVGSCSSPGDCTFESGLCTWKNTANGDQFDWTVDSGGTSSTSTGPSTDHTLGTRQGKYLYIETSAPRLTGDKAWLVSESFSPVTSSGRCISFWYSMYGATVDSLNVYIRVPGRTDYMIWHQSGNQGNGWLNGQAPITEKIKSYSIVFEGVRGRSYSGDIAIDDITFTTSNCGILPLSATAGPQTTAQVTTQVVGKGAFACDFQNDFCGWAQSTRADQFDWTRNHGGTGSYGTGPSSDHTHGNSKLMINVQITDGTEFCNDGDNLPGWTDASFDSFYCIDHKI
ncbi:MAM and LDL-receptor class A domain-containing protein 1-like [Haliotis asinina]|uniref:MAM and LDL-receptor class A domain-containing protein 1-like n=1 Tax=Haliotis asinina TaxID=109174 RepID=UPI0035318E95